MSRFVYEVEIDHDGNPVLDADGHPVIHAAHPQEDQ